MITYQDLVTRNVQIQINLQELEILVVALIRLILIYSLDTPSNIVEQTIEMKNKLGAML